MIEHSLDTLQPGHKATVVCLRTEEPLRRRFSDLGIITGTSICSLFRSPSGDPTAYRIRSTVIALRKKDAKTITVTEENTP